MKKFIVMMLMMASMNTMAFNKNDARGFVNASFCSGVYDNAQNYYRADRLKAMAEIIAVKLQNNTHRREMQYLREYLDELQYNLPNRTDLSTLIKCNNMYGKAFPGQK